MCCIQGNVNQQECCCYASYRKGKEAWESLEVIKGNVRKAIEGCKQGTVYPSHGGGGCSPH